jgi:hypothetical protein
MAEFSVEILLLDLTSNKPVSFVNNYKSKVFLGLGATTLRMITNSIMTLSNIHDTQYNYIQHNDTQPNDTRCCVLIC